MKNKLIILFGTILLISCNNQSGEPHRTKDKTTELQRDGITIVKLTDKLVIYESTCRGCEYEKSTRFEIMDSLNILKLQDIITTDDNPSNMDGGSISKDIIITPIKTGITILRLYKIWGANTATRDSANYKLYTVEVRN